MDRRTQEASWWRAWWRLDLSWEGLARLPGHDGSTLQDAWRLEAGRLIPEPGTSRRWTRFHCPFMFADGTPSPKTGWACGEWADLHTALRTRLALSTHGTPALLTGVVLDGLFEPEAGLPDLDGYLWLRADHAYFRDGLDLSRNGLGLAGFRGAWFGGAAVLDGAKTLNGDFSGAFHGYRMPMEVSARAVPVRTIATPVPRRPEPGTSGFVQTPPAPARARPAFVQDGLAGRLMVAVPLISAIASTLWLIAHQA